MNSSMSSLMSGGAPAEAELAYRVIEYLKTRYHTEAPHISVLAPDHSVILRMNVFRQKQTIEEEEPEESEIELESLEERLDPLRIRGHSTHGMQATFRNFNETSIIRFHTAFFIRKAPPAEFKKVEVIAEVIGKKDFRLILAVEDVDESSSMKSAESGQGVIEFRRDLRIERFPFRAVIAIGTPAVVEEAAKVVSSALYPGSEIVRFSDEGLINALSTSEHTKEGKIFYFIRPPEGTSGKEPGSDKYKVIQNFLYEVEISERTPNEVAVTFVLRYIAPCFFEKKTRKIVRASSEFGYPTYVYINDKKDRWSVHHLLEVESRLEWNNAELMITWLDQGDGISYPGLRGVTPIGGIAVDEHVSPQAGRLVIRDWHIAQEEIYPVEESNMSIDESFKSVFHGLIKSLGSSIDEKALNKAFNIVLHSFKKAFPHVKKLYKFQEEALSEGLKSLLEGRHRAIVLQARTAGGKTIAFLLPILIFTIYTKLVSGDMDKKGIKAILLYPTIALQNDQASTVFKLLWCINECLAETHSSTTYKDDLIISLGTLHGYSPRRLVVDKKTSKVELEDIELRLRCPLCNNRLIITWNEVQIDKKTKIYRELVKCNNESCEINNLDSPRGRLLRSMIKASRDSIYTDPPDLLITNPDIINTRLTLGGREDPASIAIFGKRVCMCSRCGAVYDRSSMPDKCDYCGSRELRFVKHSHPRVIVIDEAHLMRGAFGAQTSHVLTLLEEIIRRLNGLPKEWRPVYFVSSATLNNPVIRARELISTDENSVVVFGAQLKDRGERTHRIHVFLMPKLYSPEATVGRIIEALYSETLSALADSARAVFSGLTRLKAEVFAPAPTTLIFVNKISEANELLNFVREYAPNARSNGHTTDFRNDRVRVEDDFSRGDLDIIVATSGLEVGVDFDRVNVGIIYGMPFYTSDYTQRIGRIGRRHNCMIFNVFMPDKPIDHFYYRNWKILCDGRLREAMIKAEAYRINRENPEAVRRAIIRSIVAYISAHTYFDELEEADRLIGILESLESCLAEYLSATLKPVSTDLNSAMDIAKRFIKDLKDHVRGRKGEIKEPVKEKLPEEQVRSLRTVDFQVTYGIEDEIRERDLFFAFRHCMPGQIISYRGTFYVVESVDQFILYQSSGGSR